MPLFLHLFLYNRYINTSFILKGAQAWNIREWVFNTNQTCLDNLGIGEKKMKFRKLECFFEGFRYKYLIKLLISMRLITKKKIQDSPKKKLCENSLGTLI